MENGGLEEDWLKNLRQWFDSASAEVNWATVNKMCFHVDIHHQNKIGQAILGKRKLETFYRPIV